MAAALKINAAVARRLDQFRQRAARAQARRRGARRARQGAGAAPGRCRRAVPIAAMLCSRCGAPAEAIAQLRRGAWRRHPRHGEALLSRGTARADARASSPRRWPISTPRWRSRPTIRGALYNRGNALCRARPHRGGARRLRRARSPPRPTTLNGLEQPRPRACRRSTATPKRVASFDKALAHRTRTTPTPISTRALSLLTLGDYARGFAEYEWRWKRAGMTDRAADSARPLWLGEYSAGAQDASCCTPSRASATPFMFARYVPLLARTGATVVLEVQPELKALFAGLDGVAAVVARGEPLPPYDLHCPLGSLPLALKTEPATIPGRHSLSARRRGAHREMAAAHRSPARQTRRAGLGRPCPPCQRPQPLARRCRYLEPLLAVRRRVVRQPAARFARRRRGTARARIRASTHVGDALERLGRHRGGADAVRSYDLRRHLGRASRRRARRARPGCCCRFRPTGAGRSTANAAPGIRRCGCSASPRPAIGRASSRRLRERWRNSQVKRRRGSRSAPARADAPLASRAPRAGHGRSRQSAICSAISRRSRARIAVAAHGRDVEPLVRLDQIDRDARARRIVHAEREAAFRVGRLHGDVAANSMSAISAPHVARGRKPQWPTALSLLPGRKLRSERGDHEAENLNGSLSVAMNRR